jgi:lipopolysaccharide heptosyltransferase II
MPWRFMQYHLKDTLKEVYLKIRKILLTPFLILRRTKSPEEGEIKKILFLRHDRIGDMVLLTAALKALRMVYPHARITVIASERNYEILDHNPNVDEVIIYKDFFRFIREIRTRRYDLVIDPFLTYELKQAFMTYIAGGKYRIGFEEAGREVFFNIRGPATFPPQRMVDHLLDLAELAGGKREGCEPEVFLSDMEIQWASEVLENKGIGTNELTIAIHPGAHYPSQRWPAERFGELARRILAQCEAKVILLGSSDEEGLLKAVKDSTGNDIQIFSCDNIREFMALLSRCDLLVCNNSGPLHIASALKVPTVSMIGPTVTPLWLPYGENNVVISKPLSCSPCNRAHCKDHKCMESITVDKVFEAVQKQIALIVSKQKSKFTVQGRGRKRRRS